MDLFINGYTTKKTTFTYQAKIAFSTLNLSIPIQFSQFKNHYTHYIVTPSVIGSFLGNWVKSY